jgi:predicted N-acetyltransferase YhbS
MLCDRVFALLDTWIPTLSAARRSAERLRWRWEDCSTPFVVLRDGQVLSHVGLLETQVVCEGVPIPTGGVHAVCTLAADRRRGLYRGLIEEVLAFCDSRYPLVKLSTEHPEYYEPFGFRVIPEHRFRLAVRRTDRRKQNHENGFRALDRDDPRDLDTLDRLLARRVPVSRWFSVANDADVFKFNAGAKPLHYCATLDTLVVMNVRNGTLELEDVVAETLPDLDALLYHVPAPIDEVVFHFRPDRFDVDAAPEPHRHDGDLLMLRGEFPLDGRSPCELMLPPMARH